MILILPWIRFCSKNKSAWEEKDPANLEHVNEAARDFSLREDEEGASIYRLRADSEFETVVALHAMNNGRLRKYDLILYGGSLPACISVRYVPLETLHPFLRERHEELMGLAQEECLRELVIHLLASPDLRTYRVQKNNLRNTAARVRKDYPDIEQFSREWNHWEAELSHARTL